MTERRGGPELTRSGSQKRGPQRAGCHLSEHSSKAMFSEKTFHHPPVPPYCLKIGSIAGASSAAEGQVRESREEGMDSVRLRKLVGFLEG